MKATTDALAEALTQHHNTADELPYDTSTAAEETTGVTLLPHHVDDLRRSGLTDATIAALRFYSATRQAATAVLGFDPGCGCLAFPFPSLNGSKPFVRLKPDVPFVGADGKPAKYLSPKGAGNHLFVPRQTGLVLGDTHVSLIVTEGEKKAAKADQEGFLCVGLTGVSSWRQKPRDEDGRKLEDSPTEPIPDLDLVAWRGRTVYLAFDSDVTSKPEVRRELWALRCELVRRGATVRVVYLPEGDNGAKVGLDDFLLIAHGPEALQSLLDVAPVLDYHHRAHEVIAEPDEGNQRDDELRRLVADIMADRGVDPLTRRRIRQELVKAKVVSATDFDALCKFSGGAANSKEAEDKATLKAVLPNLVDLVLDSDGAVAFLLKQDGGLIVASDYTDGDGTHYAPPPRDKIPFDLVDADAVIRCYQSDADGALFDDLVEYHRRISDLPDSWYSLLAIWDFHTWLLEEVNYSPLLVLYAVAERGKSRTMRGMAHVAYRAITTESLRDSYLSRFTHAFGGVVCFDVMDLWRKADRAGSEDVVLQRFERGAKVPRVNKPEAGDFLDTDYYSIFGGTVVATNEPVHHILHTRALTLTMQETSRRFSEDVTPEAAMPLRARLMAFRARHLGQRLPEAEKAIGGRLGDISRPLVQMVRLVKPEWEAELVALIHDLDQERKADKAETTDGEIVRALTDCVDGVLPDDRLRVSDVVDKVNANRLEGKHLSPQYVGRRLKALGFHRGQRTSEGNTIVFDSGLLDRLQEKYGFHDPTHTPDNTSLTSQTSPGEAARGGDSGVSEVCEVSTEAHPASGETYTAGAEPSEDDDVEVFRP